MLPCGFAAPAGELPADASQIESLTPEQADALVNRAGQQFLPLTRLATLDADTARWLAKFKGQTLWLSRLTTIDALTARDLADFKGVVLDLSGITTIDAAVADAARGVQVPTPVSRRAAHACPGHGHGTGDVPGARLAFNGLKKIDGATAKAVATFRGQSLWLNGLTAARP